MQKWIAAVGAKTTYIERGSPWENGYIESFNARLRDELLNGEIFYTLRDYSASCTNSGSKSPTSEGDLKIVPPSNKTASFEFCSSGGLGYPPDYPEKRTTAFVSLIRLSWPIAYSAMLCASVYDRNAVISTQCGRYVRAYNFRF